MPRHYLLSLNSDNTILTVIVADEGCKSYQYTLLPGQTARLNSGDAIIGEIYAECELGFKFAEVHDA